MTVESDTGTAPKFAFIGVHGETPTIDLVVGYHKLKHPQFLRTFLSKMARTNEQAKANSYLW